MAKIKIGTINGRNIYTGNPAEIKDGEYFISTNGNIPSGFYVKSGKDLKPVCNCKQTEQAKPSEQNLQTVEILANYHGKKETITPEDGYDGIGKVVYKKPRLEEKDTIKITKNGITEVKVGKNYDGLDDITIIVNVEN